MMGLGAIVKKKDNEYKMGSDYIRIGHPLDREKTFESFLKSYSVYYNITRDSSLGFDAEAVFNSKSEQYFLVKAAKVADICSAEYVYFSLEDRLTSDRLKELDEKAWNNCISRAKPGPSHKNTDAVLIVMANSLDDDIPDFVKKAKHSKNYNLALYGYSNYRLIVIEFDKGVVYFNKQAKILMRLVGNILKEEKEI